MAMAALATPKTSSFGQPRLILGTPNRINTGLRLKGYLNAPGEFYEKRKDVLFRRGTESNTYLLFDHSANTITLRVDNGQGDYHEVVGQFLPHPLLNLMNFETGNVFIAQELCDYIINNGHIFQDEHSHESAVEFLSNPAKAICTSKEESEDFELRISLPLYRGCSAIDTHPHILVLLKYTTAEGTYCHLESPMWVKSFLESLRDSVFEKEKMRFKDFVCIDC